MAKSEPRFTKLPVDVIEFPDYNPREISKKDFNKLRKDIRSDPHFLIQRPPLINHITGENKYVCYAGNQRCKAAIEEGYKELNVWVEDDVPRKLQDERMLKDNLHRGEWDLSKLSDFDASFLLDAGFTPDSLNSMFDDILTINEDEFDQEKAIQEVQDRGVITRPGDIYQLGPHRLMCGDSTNPDDAKLLFGEARSKVTYSDPPYNIGYDYTKGHSAEKKRYTDTKLNDSKSLEDYQSFLTAVIANANLFSEPDAPYGVGYVEGKKDLADKFKPIANDGVIQDYYTFSKGWLEPIIPYLSSKNTYYLFNGDTKAREFLNALYDLKYSHSQVLIWNKNQVVMGRKDYQPMHELIFYGWHGRHRYYGGKDKSILTCPKPQANKLHPTMKPPRLLRKLIAHATEPGMIVYDAFGGSGSTLITCDQIGRICRMMEIEASYCIVIIQRYIKHCEKSGKEAVVRLNGVNLQLSIGQKTALTV